MTMTTVIVGSIIFLCFTVGILGAVAWQQNKRIKLLEEMVYNALAEKVAACAATLDMMAIAPESPKNFSDSLSHWLTWSRKTPNGLRGWPQIR